MTQDKLGTVETYQGWSWPGFFLGPFWLLYKRLFIHAGVIALIVIFTGFLLTIPAWIIVGWKGNEWHRQQMKEKGYKIKIIQ